MGSSAEKVALTFVGVADLLLQRQTAFGDRAGDSRFADLERQRYFFHDPGSISSRQLG